MKIKNSIFSILLSISLLLVSAFPCFAYKIAKHLGRAYNTIKDEVERGTVTLYNGKVKRYKADQGKSVYLENREHSTRRYRVFETAPFLEYVVKQFKNEHWSLDAIFEYALHKREKYLWIIKIGVILVNLD